MTDTDMSKHITCYYGNSLVVPGQRSAPDVHDRTLIPIRAPKRDAPVKQDVPEEPTRPTAKCGRRGWPVVEMVGGKVIREYPSAAAAAREHGLSAPGMSRRISKGVIKDGRSWVYKGD